MMKLKRFFKKWGLVAISAIALLSWGAATGAWGYVAITAYGLGSFISWAVRETARTPPLIVLLMLPAIQSKVDALRSWQDKAEENVIIAAREFEAEILDYNTEEQLFRRGQYSDGTAVAPPYRPFTIQVKQAKGQPTGRVTLRDTGDFHQSFSVVWQPTQFVVTASDAKTGKLVQKYGREIFGLDDAGLQELIDNIRPELIAVLRKEIGV